MSNFYIRPLESYDVPSVTEWSRIEGFAPGLGDLNIYRHTDQQGLWVGCLDERPIGCIAGVRYNHLYGFIGMFLVEEAQRGNGYGLKLWKQAFNHLIDVPCIGLEAALDRIEDYSAWGFEPSSCTTRWQWIGGDVLPGIKKEFIEEFPSIKIYEGHTIQDHVVQAYDANKEASPRPHFLSDWLNHPSGNVLVLLDSNGSCHGFGRIRPCLLQDGEGWRIGPLLADNPNLAEYLLRKLVERHPGVVLLDSPGLNTKANKLLEKLGFKEISKTLRMYRGSQPSISLNDVYGLACLELG